MIASKSIFKGYSTKFGTSQDSRLNDIALVKADLYYHFHTRMGERRGRPDFGCRIWEYHFDQLTNSAVEDINLEVERIINLETRVVLLSKKVLKSQNGVIVMAELEFKPFNVIDTFTVEFDQRQVF